jgi:hypothetical protein
MGSLAFVTCQRLWLTPYPARRLTFTLTKQVLRKVGWGAPAYVHDEEQGLFRFRDGRFAFSREHADWALLRKRGRLRG